MPLMTGGKAVVEANAAPTPTTFSACSAPVQSAQEPPADPRWSPEGNAGRGPDVGKKW